MNDTGIGERMSTTQTDTFDAKAFLRTLVPLPGVYRMLDGNGTLLYVGKARNLKKRVASYFRANPNSAKIQALVAQTRRMEVTVTHTEGEALILENNLIKAHRPRYNVSLRDDKSYPYIHLSDHLFPRISLYRGARKLPGRFFGPYPSAGATRDTITLMQRVFQLRKCSDSFYANRSRPCLLFQIKRCSGPCTNEISPQGYARDVQDAIRVLEGKSDQVIEGLTERMEKAAATLAFEQAARYRDQIVNLQRVQARQYVDADQGDLDVVACAMEGGAACVQVFFFRGGRLLGNKPFFPKVPEDETAEEILGAFLAQFYLDKDPPREIVIDRALEDAELLASVLAERSGHKVAIHNRVRTDRARWLAMARSNAVHALSAQLLSRSGMRRRFEALQDALGLEFDVTRMECFDISHTMGENTVASCVVFNEEGPLKSDYRRFNIEGIIGGDDYGAMRQALTRRYTRLRDEDAPMPDILFIDGGKGQLAQAEAVLDELQVEGITLVGVAKGPERRAGLEVLYLSGSDRPLMLPADSAALHLVQQIRDEAHRFAIAGHRQRRGKQRRESTLETIAGVGPKRRQALLQQFGGLKQLSRAGVEDILRVDGINRELAQRIYDALHSGND